MIGDEPSTISLPVASGIGTVLVIGIVTLWKFLWKKIGEKDVRIAELEAKIEEMNDEEKADLKLRLAREEKYRRYARRAKGGQEDDIDELP